MASTLKGLTKTVGARGVFKLTGLNYVQTYSIIPNKRPGGAAFFKRGAFIKVSKIEVSVT